MHDTFTKYEETISTLAIALNTPARPHDVATALNERARAIRHAGGAHGVVDRADRLEALARDILATEGAAESTSRRAPEALAILG